MNFFMTCPCKISIRAMGNCLFESLNAFLHVGTSDKLRQALCDYIDANRSQFEQDILALRYSSVDNYLETVRRDGVDGNHIMVCAAALKYHARVQIRMPNGRVFIEEPPQQQAPLRSVFLKWVPGHYSVAKKDCPKHRRCGSI